MQAETIQIHKKEAPKKRLLDDVQLQLELGLKALKAGKVKRVR